MTEKAPWPEIEVNEKRGWRVRIGGLSLTWRAMESNVHAEMRSANNLIKVHRDEAVIEDRYLQAHGDGDVDHFFILDLRSLGMWRGMLWWMPNDCGYTENLTQAGRYTREQVENNPRYYNNGEETLAVPVALVLKHARPELRVPEDMRWTFKQKLMTKEREAAP